MSLNHSSPRRACCSSLSLELEAYDPRGLLIPVNPGLRSLTVRDVQDADDWLEELLSVISTDEPGSDSAKPSARFPNLRHLSLFSTTMLSFPVLPLTRLTHLDLSHNLLNSIPSSLSHLHSLQSLNLSNNLITSVRNAPSVLGNITTINLSKNRIDCLVGLERVLGLERVDVRSNELMEVGEVGRLAVLPHLNGVWCVNNLFDHDGEDWRSELGISLAAERKPEVVIDGRPWSWQEKRKIDAAIAAMGGPRPASSSQPHSRQSSNTNSHSPHSRQASSTVTTPIQPARSGPAASSTGTAQSTKTPGSSSGSRTSPPTSTTADPPIAAPVKKRRPRRVITLDEESVKEADEQSRGGSVRLPKPSKDAQDYSASTEVRRSKNGNGRSVLRPDTFEPPGNGPSS